MGASLGFATCPDNFWVNTTTYRPSLNLLLLMGEIWKIPELKIVADSSDQFRCSVWSKDHDIPLTKDELRFLLTNISLEWIHCVTQDATSHYIQSKAAALRIFGIERVRGVLTSSVIS